MCAFSSEAEKKNYVFLSVIICKLPSHFSFPLWKIDRENKAPIIAMPRNISQLKPESLAIRMNVNQGGRKRKKQLIEKHKKIPQLFLEGNSWNRLWREIILIICIIRQEGRRAVLRWLSEFQ